MPLGDDFNLCIEREWFLSGNDDSAKVILYLHYTGPHLARGTSTVITCTSMMDVMTAAARLIEDKNKFKWNEKKQKWIS